VTRAFVRIKRIKFTEFSMGDSGLPGLDRFDFLVQLGLEGDPSLVAWLAGSAADAHMGQWRTEEKTRGRPPPRDFALKWAGGPRL
jgi:hypothetical protein